MTAAEFTDLDHPRSMVDFASPRSDGEGLTDEHANVFVDDEWCVVDGSAELAALLGLDGDSIVGSPIGRLLHPDDVVVSPARIWRSGRSAVLKFRFGDDGYRRLAVKIRRAANGWLLGIDGLEAEVVRIAKLQGIRN